MRNNRDDPHKSNRDGIRNYRNRGGEEDDYSVVKKSHSRVSSSVNPTHLSYSETKNKNA